MLRSRIVTTATAFLAFLALALGGASAQTTQPAAGTPLPLLKFVHQTKNKATPRTRPKPVAKIAKKTTAKRRIASRSTAKMPQAVAQGSRTSPAVTTVAPSDNIWPAADTAGGNVAPGNTGVGDVAPGNTPPAPAAMLAPQPAPPSVTTETVVETNPNAILGNGHTVQLTSSDELKPIDLTPDDGQVPAKTENAPDAAAASQPVVHAMVANAAINDPSSPIGSISWIAHALAALGGAITAGVVAWLLIGRTPRQNYG